MTARIVPWSAPESEEDRVSDVELNKKNAVSFYETMFNDCKPREAIAQFVGDEYIQHNPHVVSGKEGFISYFEEMARNYPGKRVKVKRVIGEGDKVVLHCHQIWPDEEYAGIDIFRFDAAGKIVEHWDVLQTIPQQSKHDNGMF